MSPRALLLVSWILVGTALLVVHAVLVWQSLSAKELAWKWRLLGLAPVAAPIVAWRAGRRVAPLLWAALLLVYCVLRLFG